MAALANRSYSLTGDGDPERLSGAPGDARRSDVLGVQPVLGRTFAPEEDRPGAPKVAIISHALWHHRFGGARGITGRDILLDGEPHTVVGVMPAGFDFPEKDTSVWTPFAFTAQQAANRRGHYLRVVARLQPGVTMEGAQRDMDANARRLQADHPETNSNIGIRLRPLRDQLVGNTDTALGLLLAVAGAADRLFIANLMWRARRGGGDWRFASRWCGAFPAAGSTVTEMALSPPAGRCWPPCVDLRSGARRSRQRRHPFDTGVLAFALESGAHHAAVQRAAWRHAWVRLARK
jgi:hypothetical protein